MITPVFVWVKKPSVLAITSTWESIPYPSNIFLSSSWVQAWIVSSGLPDWMLEVMIENKTVAVGLFCEKTHKRPFGFNSKALHLNMTGDENKDQIWAEYNGLKCESQYKKNIYSTLVDEIFHFHESITEIDFGLIEKEDSLDLRSDKYIVEQLIETKGYKKFLVKDQETNTFSKSLKSQISRTKKLLEKKGVVECLVESDALAVKKSFNELSDEHINTWGDSSGFHNPYFLSFHASLIGKDTEEVQAKLAKLFLDGKLLASNFYYVYNETAYFYLGVTKKSEDNRVKVGLYLHYLMLFEIGKWNCNVYDFLAGDYLYKKRMSNSSVELERILIKKRTVKFRIESLLKKLKAILAIIRI